MTKAYDARNRCRDNLPRDLSRRRGNSLFRKSEKGFTKIHLPDRFRHFRNGSKVTKMRYRLARPELRGKPA